MSTGVRCDSITFSLPLVASDNAGSELIYGVIVPTGEQCEPFGIMTFDDMIKVFAKQGKALSEGRADCFLIEDMPSLSEIRAAVIALKPFELPIFVTVTIDGDGVTSADAPPLSYLISLQSLGVSAFGIYSPESLETLTEQLEAVYPFAQIPLIARISDNQADTENVKTLIEKGADIILCGCSAEESAKISDTAKNTYQSIARAQKQETEFIAACDSSAFFTNFESMRMTDPISCEVDMSDVLLELEDGNYDAIRIIIDSADDGYLFSQNAHMCKLPVVFYPQTEKGLESALKYYHGRAIADSQCPLDEEALKEICKKYGAIIY